MMEIPYRTTINLLDDDLSRLQASGPLVVTMGEVMIRETPADNERPERTRLVHLSLAGSEFTLAIGLSRLDIPTAYITRVPANAYGFAVRNTARENGVDADHIVWAPKTEPIGRYIYEMGRTPRKSLGVYQRMYSAASRLDRGMVNWADVFCEAKIFHTSGITFGLAEHSRYARNFNLDAFMEAIENKPERCLVGMDFNYRGTLWSPEQAIEVMTPVVKNHVDILITTIEDMALLYRIGCGKYSADEVVRGDIGELSDENIKDFASRVIEKFNVEIVAITIRYPDSFEVHRWESAAMDKAGNFFRSPRIYSITLLDRLGGGDTWNAGFYYGLITCGFNFEGIIKGIFVGDAATRLKQTLMFDLPIVGRAEIQNLIQADISGGGKRTSR